MGQRPSELWSIVPCVICSAQVGVNPPKAENHVAALELLDEYLADDPNDIQLAMALLQRAESLAATGDHQSAITAFREALNAQRARPNVCTQAWLLFPWFIVEHECRELYHEATEILCEFNDDSALSLPNQKYQREFLVGATADR